MSRTALPALRPLWLAPSSRCCCRLLSSATTTAATARSVLYVSQRAKGDYGFNVFHNSNPQHGASYARHERRMRDDEVEDFMKSVKGWVLVREALAAQREDEKAENEAWARRLPQSQRAEEEGSAAPSATAPTEGSRPHEEGGAVGAEGDEPPEPSPLKLGEEAIQRTYHFSTFGEAYLFMGRFWAFCYGTDKYPPVTWDGCNITVYLYSPSFHGLSKREARVAAFLNDQYNMLKRSRSQQERVLDGVAKKAAIEELLGEAVRREMAERHAARTAPLPEASADGLVDWEELMAETLRAKGGNGDGVERKGL